MNVDWPWRMQRKILEGTRGSVEWVEGYAWLWRRGIDVRLAPAGSGVPPRSLSSQVCGRDCGAHWAFHAEGPVAPAGNRPDNRILWPRGGRSLPECRMKQVLNTVVGALLVTPPAPGLFSTTTGWPSDTLNLYANRRPITSCEPPGVSATRKRCWSAGRSRWCRCGWRKWRSASRCGLHGAGSRSRATRYNPSF